MTEVVPVMYGVRTTSVEHVSADKREKVWTNKAGTTLFEESCFSFCSFILFGSYTSGSFDFVTLKLFVIRLLVL